MQQRAYRFTLRTAIGLAMAMAGGAAWLLPGSQAQQPAAQPVVEKFVLDDTIQPVSADELTAPLPAPIPTAPRRC